MYSIDPYQKLQLITPQISINGNIIANSGFQRQFATTTNSDGEPALSASVLTAIGTIQSAGQIVAMVSMPL